MTQDISASTEALRRLIEESAQAQCRAIDAETEAEIHAIVRQAHKEAREKVHRAVERERRQEREREERLRAELDTHDRQHLLETTTHTLARGWQQLDEMLVALWQAHECRSEWIRSLIEHAQHKLPHVQWRIEHPEFLADDIKAEWDETIRQHTGHAPDWQASAQIRAGLRIVAAGVYMDGTLAGLLADRQTLEARLLDHIEHCMEERRASASDADNEDNPHG